jgi:hypothetical protein
MKKRIISTMMAFTLCFGIFGIPKLPVIPNITNSVTLPKVNIPTKYFENIEIPSEYFEGLKFPIKVVL